MNGAFYIGATGLRAQQTALDVVANNIANLNTQAFKRSQVRFSELMAPAGAASLDWPAAGAALDGVMVDASRKDFGAGPLKRTERPLDLAIDGEGFIELLGPNGELRLWRGGTLTVDRDGGLAGPNGLPLKARVTLGEDDQVIRIGADGRVEAQAREGAAFREVGRIELVKVKDPALLTAAGEGLYQVSGADDLILAQPGEDGVGALVQGAIETSNVDLTEEMITLLLMQRTYAANAQVVQAGDQLMSIANNLRR